MTLNVSQSTISAQLRPWTDGETAERFIKAGRHSDHGRLEAVVGKQEIAKDLCSRNNRIQSNFKLVFARRKTWNRQHGRDLEIQANQILGVVQPQADRHILNVGALVKI